MQPWGKRQNLPLALALPMPLPCSRWARPRARARARSGIRPDGERSQHLLHVVPRFRSLDRLAQSPHEVEIEGQVVDRVQPEAEQLLRGEEVAQVSAAERAGGRAAGTRV